MWKIPTTRSDCIMQSDLKSRSPNSNSYILLNFHTNESFTIQELPRSTCTCNIKICATQYKKGRGSSSKKINYDTFVPNFPRTPHYEYMKLRRIEVFDIRLNIVLSVVLSFESVHFQQDDLLDAVRLICAAQPGFSASSTTYV